MNIQKKLKIILGCLCLITSSLFAGNISHPAVSKKITSDAPTGILIADPQFIDFHVAPPANYRNRMQAVKTSTIQINFLPANSPDAKWGDQTIDWPADVSNAFIYAAGIWETILKSSVPITINAGWVDNLPYGVLGHSGTISLLRDFPGAPIANTYYPVSLGNSLSGSDLDPGSPDIYMGFSSSFSWYTGTDGNTPGSKYDLATVILHEICHGLGFAGGFYVLGGFGKWQNSPYPNAYDRFTEDNSGVGLIDTTTYPNNSIALRNVLTSGNLFFNGTLANAANGGNRVKLYSPGTWNGGSSYSHLGEIFNNTPNALMTYSLGYGESIHNPGLVTEGLLSDIGWRTEIISLLPFIDITNTPITLLYFQTTTDISGTNFNIAGQLTWINNVHSNTANFFSQGFRTTVGNLIEGNNLIEVFGTNIYGYFTNDSILINRQTFEDAAPVGVVASDGNYFDNVQISWDISAGAEKYRVYRNVFDLTSGFTQVSSDISETNFTDSTIIPGTIYYYFIKAGKNDLWSGFGISDNGYAKLSQPANISATDGNYNDKIVITWSNVLGAVAYNIYRSETNKANLATLLETLSNNIYTDVTVITGKKYYYWIKATADVGDSEMSDSDSGFVLVSQSKQETQGKWKYKSKNGKTKLSIKGIGLDMDLASYLENGCLVGLKDATNYETLDGPRKLAPKKKKNENIKFWLYNEKKDAVIKYKPNSKKPKKDKLSYKVWKNLPQEIIFFVQPNVEDENAVNFIKPVYELYLIPSSEMKNGWQELKTE